MGRSEPYARTISRPFRISHTSWEVDDKISASAVTRLSVARPINALRRLTPPTRIALTRWTRLMAMVVRAWWTIDSKFVDSGLLQLKKRSPWDKSGMHSMFSGQYIVPSHVTQGAYSNSSHQSPAARRSHPTLFRWCFATEQSEWLSPTACATCHKERYDRFVTIPNTSET
jgi:hypothetical protein